MLIILSQQIYFRLLSDITSYEKQKINTYVLYKYSFYMAIARMAIKYFLKNYILYTYEL